MADAVIEAGTRPGGEGRMRPYQRVRFPPRCAAASAGPPTAMPAPIHRLPRRIRWARLRRRPGLAPVATAATVLPWRGRHAAGRPRGSMQASAGATPSAVITLRPAASARNHVRTGAAPAMQRRSGAQDRGRSDRRLAIGTSTARTALRRSAGSRSGPVATVGRRHRAPPRHRRQRCDRSGCLRPRRTAAPARPRRGAAAAR